MTTFEEREKGFEAKFLHDQELQFRIMNRRNRLLGLWAAEMMGFAGMDAQSYAGDVVAADLERPGDDDVHDKVHADLRTHGIDLSDHRLRRKMNALIAVARDQIMNESFG